MAAFATSELANVAVGVTFRVFHNENGLITLLRLKASNICFSKVGYSFLLLVVLIHSSMLQSSKPRKKISVLRKAQQVHFRKKDTVIPYGIH